MLPYKRIEEYFKQQLHIPISQGSVYNFNNEAYEKLGQFDGLVKASLMHVDETGVNVAGKRHWLHCASNQFFTSFMTHEKRGSEARNSMNIIPRFEGVLCHDHWKAYYLYENCLHSLCNAHHLRELTFAHKQDKKKWAGKMKIWLEKANKAVNQDDGELNQEKAKQFWLEYRKLLSEAEIECSPTDEKERNGKRGRLKRSKSHNLLERLIKYDEDTVRFMEKSEVPFTNNQGERDIRMTKVQQKISGAFRSLDGAKMFCRIRGYLSTCKK